MVIILQIIKVFAIITIIIGCIFSLPAFAIGLIAVLFIIPGVKIWQVVSDKIDEEEVLEN